MRKHILERMLWCGALVGAGVAVRAFRGEAAAWPSATERIPLAPAMPLRYSAESLARGAAYVIANDPFRLSRQPAAVAYAPALDGATGPVVARPTLPNLILRGIVGGPPWSAIVEGIPGRQGSAMLRTGDSVASFVVRRVGRDTVIVQGADTTWRLTVRRTW